MSHKISTIRKWYGTWGIAHTFVSPNTPPQKFFVHLNNRKSPDAVLEIGTRISFMEGEPRTAGELSQALDIELAPPLPVEAAKTKTAEVNPSSEVKP